MKIILVVFIVLFCFIDSNTAQESIPGVVLPMRADTTPPSSPSDLLASSIENKKINLTWTLSSSNDVAYYNIYFDNGTGTIDYEKVLATVDHRTKSWNSSPLKDNITYKFAVRAIDTSGNEKKIQMS